MNVPDQVGTPYLRLVRALESDDTGLSSHVGLTFSANASLFLVVEGGAQTTTDIIQLDRFASRSGVTRIAAGVPEPINVASDDRRARLLILRPVENQLLEVRQGPGGNLEPTSLTAHDVRHFALQNPQGMTVDPTSGALFFLDATGPWIVRVEPPADGRFEGATISAVSLQGIGVTEARGLALDPTTTHLHLLSVTDRKLYEVTQAGDVVAIRELSDFRLATPRGMVFAPSGDQTDDPARMSLYLVDGGTVQEEPGGVGPSDARLQWSPQIVELSLTPPRLELQGGLRSAASAATGPFKSSVVQVTDMAAWSPPSPDPSGLTYLPFSNSLLMVDGEVEEKVSKITHFQGANVWELTLGGSVISTANISSVAPTSTPMSDEPTGVAWDPRTGRYFFSDDSAKKVFILNPGADGRIGTADDRWTSFSTSSVGSGDPEGIAYDPVNDRLFVADGVNEEIYEFTVTGTLVNRFDVTRYGVVDPESVEFNPDSGTLFVLSNTRNPIIIETTRSGTLLQTIDISAARPDSPAGLAYAPASNGSSAKRFYIVTRGVDNNSDPRIIDGKMYEMTAPGSSSTTLAPPQPAFITATAVSSTQIDVSWAVSTGATGYRVERSTNAGTSWATAVTTGATAFSDTGLSPATTYYYRVIATNADGDSAPSAMAQATTPASGGGNIAFTNLGTNATPDLNTSSGASSYSTASWTPPTTGLIILFVQSNRSGGPDTPTISGNGLTWVQIGTTLTASSGKGLSVFVANASGATSGPTNISFGSNSQAHCVALFAHATGVDLSSGVAGAVVQRPTRTGSGTNGSLAFAAAGDAANRQVVAYYHAAPEDTTHDAAWREFDDVNGSGASRGVQTQVKSDAFSLSSSASWSTSSAWGAIGLEFKAQATAGTGGTGSAPPPPSNVTATAVSSTQINVSWTASSGATSYRVERSATAGTTWTTAGTTSATAYSDTGLAAATTYHYRVVAANTAGTSGPSGMAQATTWAPSSSATVRVQVNSGTDDAEERVSSGVVDLTSSDLELVEEAGVQVVGVRFQNVAIPQGAVVQAANIQFTADETGSATTSLEIYAQAADDAPSFTTSTGNVSGRSKTAARVPWNPPAWTTIGAAGAAERTPDLRSVVQEVVSRAGWSSGRAMVFIITGTGRRTAESFDGDAPAAAVLNVTYALSSDPPPPTTLAAPTGVSATPVSTTGIDVRWTASSGAAGYRIERRRAGEASWATAGTTSGATAFSDVGLAAATTYEYRVVATNATNESAPSAVAQATTLTGSAPVTVTIQVSASSDDAEELVSSGAVNLTSSDLELVEDAGIQVVGLRFQNVTIPRGAVIQAATIQFTADRSGSTTTSLQIQAEAADDAPGFTTSTRNVSSRSKTAASVPWDPPAWTSRGVAGNAERTPDLRSLVQEVVRRTGWSSGRAMVFIITGTGKRQATSFDGSAPAAAVLSVTYTP